MTRLRPTLLSVASGILFFLSVAKFDLWPLAWVAFVPLLWTLRAATPRRAFWLGWLTGAMLNIGGFYWIGSLLERFGHMPWLGAFPLFLLLTGYQGLLFGLWAYLVRRLSDLEIRGWRVPLVLVAPVTMAALELVYPMMFPWYLAISQAWVVPVIQVAELGGPIAVTFLLVLFQAALLEVLVERPRPWRRALACAGVVIASLSFGFVRIAQTEHARAAAPKLKVGLVQANLGILEGDRRVLAPKLLRIEQDMSADLVRRGAQLLVWPESAYPYAFRHDQAADWTDGRAVLRGFSVPTIIGAATFKPDVPFPYNSALLLEPDRRVGGIFDKNYLMLFGEYIPFYEDIPWFQKIFPEASNLARGHDVTTFALGPYRLAPMICYEDIIPAFGRRLAALRPHLFVNLTNDAWFGRTSEPYQHLALAVFRSVEHRLDLVRSVNTGVSAFIDATGRVIQKGPSVDPLETPDAPTVALLGEVALMEPTGLYGKLGDAFGVLNCVATLGLAGLAVYQRRRQRTDQKFPRG